MYCLTSGDQNAVFAPLTINGAPCLATGFSTRAYSHPADRSEAVEERVADLLAQGWHLTT